MPLILLSQNIDSKPNKPSSWIPENELKSQLKAIQD